MADEDDVDAFLYGDDEKGRDTGFEKSFLYNFIFSF